MQPETIASDACLKRLRGAMTTTDERADQILFRRGDPADRLFLIERGRVVLEDVTLTLGPGELFGEIALFTSRRRRTLTARCDGPCTLRWMSDTGLRALCLRDPEIGLFLLNLIADRLIDGAIHSPEAYDHLARP